MPRMRSAPLILLLVLTTGCASSGTTFYRLALASDQLAMTAQRLQQTEIALYDAGKVTDKAHAQWQIGFYKLGESLRLLNASVRVGSTQDVQARARAVLTLLDAMIDYASGLDADTRVLLVTAIEAVRTLVVLLGTVEP